MVSIAQSKQTVQPGHTKPPEIPEEYISIKLADFQDMCKENAELVAENKILREYSAGRLELEERNAQLEGVIEEQAEEIKVLRQENEDARERTRRAEQIKELEQDKIQRLEKIISLPTKNISASEKLVLWAIDKATGGETANEGSKLVDISVAHIGKEIGMSRGTAGDNIKKLAERGYIEREVGKDNLGDGKYLTHVQVGRNLFTDNPDLLVLEKGQERNHGGERVVCEDCGGENVDIYQAYTCRDCGRSHNTVHFLKRQTGKRGRKLGKINLLLVEGSVENSTVGQLDPREIEQADLF